VGQRGSGPPILWHLFASGVFGCGVFSATEPDILIVRGISAGIKTTRCWRITHIPLRARIARSLDELIEIMTAISFPVQQESAFLSRL
jgi:hypothetical protein